MRVLTAITLLLVSATGFSKGGPVAFSVLAQTHYYFTPYFSDTVVFELNQGDSCKLTGYGPSPDYIDWVNIYRNDTLVAHLTAPYMSPIHCWLKKEGVYRAEGYNIYGTRTVHFQIRFKPSTIITNDHLDDTYPARENVLEGMVPFPNPAINVFTVNIPVACEHCLIEVFDSKGKIVYTNPFVRKGETTINCQQWIPGLYIVAVQANDTSVRYKLVKH
ncbi:MAG TPA: T9SS type A sorting domain-containing protein [Flavobacteriales bacterium]|nr:T9SS type A sorting domain-containing protein [Flavobacteriales bacterium]